MSAPTITLPALPPAAPVVPESLDRSSASATREVPLSGGYAGSPAGGPRELLVAVRDPADLSRSLVSAAARARAAHRPLSVVVVEAARPWTIDAAVIGVQDRRRAREIASLTAAARTMCARVGVEVREVLVLRPGWAWTRTGRERAVEAQLRAIARRRGAELHGAAFDDGEPHDADPHGAEAQAVAAGPGEFVVGAR